MTVSVEWIQNYAQNYYQELAINMQISDIENKLFPFYANDKIFFAAWVDT